VLLVLLVEVSLLLFASKQIYRFLRRTLLNSQAQLRIIFPLNPRIFISDLVKICALIGCPLPLAGLRLSYFAIEFYLSSSVAVGGLVRGQLR